MSAEEMINNYQAREACQKSQPVERDWSYIPDSKGSKIGNAIGLGVAGTGLLIGGALLVSKAIGLVFGEETTEEDHKEA